MLQTAQTEMGAAGDGPGIVVLTDMSGRTADKHAVSVDEEVGILRLSKHLTNVVI